jgi:hypothetical protein
MGLKLHEPQPPRGRDSGRLKVVEDVDEASAVRFEKCLTALGLQTRPFSVKH